MHDNRYDALSLRLYSLDPGQRHQQGDHHIVKRLTLSRRQLGEGLF